MTVWLYTASILLVSYTTTTPYLLCPPVNARIRPVRYGVEEPRRRVLTVAAVALGLAVPRRGRRPPLHVGSRRLGRLAAAEQQCG